MAWTFTVLVEAHEDTSGDTIVSTGSFSFDADKLLLLVAAGNDSVGDTTDQTISSNTTGLTFTEIELETVEYSIGGSAIKVWGCIPSSGGSGTIEITSVGGNNNSRSVHVIEVDGGDISGGVAGIVVEVVKNHTTGTAGDPISAALADLAAGNAAFSAITTTISGFDQDFGELTNDYTGSSGAMGTGYSEADNECNIDGLGAGVLGGAAMIVVELKGFAPPLELGVPGAVQLQGFVLPVRMNFPRRPYGRRR